MRYDLGSDEFSNWMIAEDQFDQRYLGKCEAIMALGNGYIGIRSSTEESYVGETRDTFVAGIFNKFDEYEVTELPNAADVIQMDIELNEEIFDLTQGSIQQYCRVLNLKTGELKREVTWISPKGEAYDLTFKRFVSLKDLHLIGQKIEITPKSSSVNIKLNSGINGQMTNSGVQHFSEGEKRLYDEKYMQFVQTTTESKINFVVNTTHNFQVDLEEIEPQSLIMMGRRKIFYDYAIKVQQGKTFTIEKISNIYTSRDKENEKLNLDQLKEYAFLALKAQNIKGYDALLVESIEMWVTKVWDKYGIVIDCQDNFDQLAIRFAQYHLTIMTPAHDNRMSIAAKGLSGEGYKGHSFWDAEIFILPFWIYTDPKVARSLLEYRYYSLPGAHKKAKENGYKGSMFPWESAWLDDGEVTPVWGAADIITGKATKIWSGFIEQHITSDIAFATWQYYQVTKDEEFMEKYGYELFMDTAKFWCSRLEWNEERNEYHINDVIGPDEYKEHVNNNAFTNYMAYWTIKNAIEYYHILKKNKEEIFNRLNDKLNLEQTYEEWVQKINNIYLPQPQENLVIPQDDTYLQKTIIDLSKYKSQKNVGSIFKEYNLEQVNEMQVSKQADIMALFYLLENYFSREVKVANWNYYEPKTLHDSSLSLSTHCVLASDLGEKDLAYALFNRAANIDLGPNRMSSVDGIHAASIGGIWQCIVNGFGGVRMLDGTLRIEPHLPKSWTKLIFPINWHGDRLNITIDKDTISIVNSTNNNEQIEFLMNGQIYELQGSFISNYNKQ